MNHNKNTLPYLMALLGAVLLSLRLRLYIVAVDGKNLLESGHVLSWIIWAVCALCLVVAAGAAFRTREENSLSVGGPIAALGDGIFAIGIGLTLLALGRPFSVLEKLRFAVGALCVPCLCYAAFCRGKGKPVFFGCFAVVCAFFALYLVGNYRLWSSNPQLQDYIFAMLTCVAVTLFAYQNAAHCVGIGSKRLWLASGLTAVSFGLAALCRGENMLLYLTAGVWALTNLLGNPLPREKGEY